MNQSSNQEPEGRPSHFSPAKSYIIRFWTDQKIQEENNSGLIIRLEDPRTGHTHLFRGYDELISFFQAESEQKP